MGAHFLSSAGLGFGTPEAGGGSGFLFESRGGAEGLSE